MTPTSPTSSVVVADPAPPTSAAPSPSADPLHTPSAEPSTAPAPSTSVRPIASVPPNVAVAARRAFNQEEANAELARVARQASSTCARLATSAVAMTVTGKFLPDGTFTDVLISPDALRFTDVGACVWNSMQAHISAFDGPPHPAGTGITVAPP
ncbi:MAG: hypothetical protein U0414_12265 [Polyangiaceae bacterium]